METGATKKNEGPPNHLVSWMKRPASAHFGPLFLVGREERTVFSPRECLSDVEF